MYEKISNKKDDDRFLLPGEIEIKITEAKEERNEDQLRRYKDIVEILKERGLDCSDFYEMFTRWQRIEQEIISENEDGYAEEQTKLLVKEAEIFEEAWLMSKNNVLLEEALKRLEGTEEGQYYDGAMYDAEMKYEDGIINEDTIENIRLKISKLKEYLSVKE